MGRQSKLTIELTREQEQHLLAIAAAGTSEHRLVRRAEVILLSVKGLPLKEIGAKVRMHVNGVRRWRQRFAAQGLAGLADAPRPGAARRITPDQRAAVVARACTKPTDGQTRWSQAGLAKACGVSKATVQRILAEAHVKPHKTHFWCGRSPDSEFAAKQAKIIGLYMNPPQNALVLSVDEKSQMQALDRTQPELPLAPNQPRRQTATYVRHGTVCLLAALAVHTGEVTARVIPRNDHANFLAFLKYLYRRTPGRDLHIIVDNLSTHRHAEVMAWVNKRRRLHLHFTPTYASWLNQVEIWLHIFTAAVVRGGIWKSRQAMVQQIMQYIRTYNQTQAHPFAWTYTGKPLTA